MAGCFVGRARVFHTDCTACLNSLIAARGIMTVLIVQALVLALQDRVLALVRLSSVPVQHARSAVLDRF